MQGWLDHALSWWQEERGGSAEQVERVWEGFLKLRPLLATRGTHFMLFDGRPDHFIIQGDKVSGLIDLEEACGGDAAMDLGVMAVLDPDLLDGIMAGYSATEEEQMLFSELVPFYTFIRRLAASEWNLNYGESSLAKRAEQLISQNPWPPEF